MSDKHYGAYKLIPPGPSFLSDQTDDERAIIARPLEYWISDLAPGHVDAFGPVLDPAGVRGLAVIEVDEPDQAVRLHGSDPAATSALGTPLIHPMLPAPVRPLTVSPS